MCISLFNNFNFCESREAINALRLDFSEVELAICIQIFLQNFEKTKKDLVISKMTTAHLWQIVFNGSANQITAFALVY